MFDCVQPQNIFDAMVIVIVDILLVWLHSAHVSPVQCSKFRHPHDPEHLEIGVIFFNLIQILNVVYIAKARKGSIMLGKSHVELWDIKFIPTLVLTATDLSAKTTSLMDIFEPHQFLMVAYLKTNPANLNNI